MDTDEKERVEAVSSPPIDSKPPDSPPITESKIVTENSIDAKEPILNDAKSDVNDSEELLNHCKKLENDTGHANSIVPIDQNHIDTLEKTNNEDEESEKLLTDSKDAAVNSVSVPNDIDEKKEDSLEDELVPEPDVEASKVENNKQKKSSKKKTTSKAADKKTTKDSKSSKN